MEWICKQCGADACTIETGIVDKIPCQYCVKNGSPASWKKVNPVVYAIDFDGTIVENEWPHIGKVKAEVTGFIRQLQDIGDKWILWTMREGKRLDEAVAFLHSIGLKPDAVNDNLPDLCTAFGNNPRKVFANVYIDDHNAGGLVACPPQDGQVKNR